MVAELISLLGANFVAIADFGPSWLSVGSRSSGELGKISFLSPELFIGGFMESFCFPVSWVIVAEDKVDVRAEAVGVISVASNLELVGLGDPLIKPTGTSSTSRELVLKMTG